VGGGGASKTCSQPKVVFGVRRLVTSPPVRRFPQQPDTPPYTHHQARDKRLAKKADAVTTANEARLNLPAAAAAAAPLDAVAAAAAGKELTALRKALTKMAKKAQGFQQRSDRPKAWRVELPLITAANFAGNRALPAPSVGAESELKGEEEAWPPQLSFASTHTCSVVVSSLPRRRTLGAALAGRPQDPTLTSFVKVGAFHSESLSATAFFACAAADLPRRMFPSRDCGVQVACCPLPPRSP
jgi:hypothetical protein